MSAAAGAAGAQQQLTKIKKKSSPDRYRAAQWLDVNKIIADFGLTGKIKNSCWSCLFECRSQKQNVCTQGEKKGGGGAPNQPRSHPLQGRCCKVSSPNMDSNEEKEKLIRHWAQAIHFQLRLSMLVDKVYSFWTTSFSHVSESKSGYWKLP